jgi:hypothetical protein
VDFSELSGCHRPVVIPADGFNEEGVLRAVATVEVNCEHLLARAVAGSLLRCQTLTDGGSANLCAPELFVPECLFRTDA